MRNWERDMLPEDLSRLIGTIYDAALSPGLLPEVLRRCATFVDAQGAGLLTKGVDEVGSVNYQVGVDPAYIESYQSEYWRYDPLTPLVLFDVGQVTARIDYIDDAEFLEGRFQREWAGPQGWVDAANVVVEKSGLGYSVLSFLRSEAAGRVDDEMRRRIDLIFPHIRRAVLVGQAIGAKTEAIGQFAAVLDRIHAGIFLFGRDWRVVHCNRAAERLLKDGALRLEGGRLESSDPSANRTLRAAFTGPGTLDDAGIAMSIMAPNEVHHVGHLLPLGDGARRDVGLQHQAIAALFVKETAWPEPSLSELVARRFDLTPAELRVLLAIPQADGAAAIAVALGITEHTVRSHLTHLFNKTGRRRQAELIKLLAEFRDPAAG